jgi:hypothetical protein
MRSIFCIVAFFLGGPLFISSYARPAQERQEHGAPRHAAPHANQGRIPPAPARHSGGQEFRREEERRDNGEIDRTPHVNHDHWYGNDAPNDGRYRIAHPFERGRFEHSGPSYRYNVVRIDRDGHRFWLNGGFFFQIASWDWDFAASWCWDCGDNFVVYDDPDHPGWYLVYNTETGTYLHAEYVGG